MNTPTKAEALESLQAIWDWTIDKREDANVRRVRMFIESMPDDKQSGSMTDFEQLLADLMKADVEIYTFRVFRDYFKKGLKDLYLSGVKPSDVEQVSNGLERLYDGEPNEEWIIDFGTSFELMAKTFSGQKKGLAMKEVIIEACLKLFVKKYPEYLPKTNKA